MFPEQVRSDEGTLETKHLFRIPNAGVIHRPADPIGDVRISRFASDLPALHHGVQSLKTAKPPQSVVGQEYEQGFEERNHKELLGSASTPSSWQMKASL